MRFILLAVFGKKRVLRDIAVPFICALLSDTDQYTNAKQNTISLYRSISKL